jgi:hypothetical protein
MKSETSICSTNRDSIHEKNQFRHTLLHLASNWPYATAILLKQGADPNITDACGLFPISFACYNQCQEAVQILLDAGSHLSSIRTSCENERYQTVLEDAFIVGNEAIISAILFSMVDRRKRFETIARDLLSLNIAKPVLEPNIVMDSAIYDLCLELADAGFAIPKELGFSSCELHEKKTVYHMMALTANTAEKLWLLGFKDINDYDAEGLTPLMLVVKGSVKRLALVPWLIARGAALD